MRTELNTFDDEDAVINDGRRKWEEKLIEEEVSSIRARSYKKKRVT